MSRNNPSCDEAHSVLALCLGVVSCHVPTAHCTPLKADSLHGIGSRSTPLWPPYSPLLSPEQIAATRWSPDSLLTNGFGSADVSNALNALPGVLMETRGMGGSRRINVRGSALRSPFAVRNTMLFVRGFMLTEADGTSPCGMVGPLDVGPMELVSGAAATTFGGAYGGALVVPRRRPNPVQGHLTVWEPQATAEGIQSRVTVRCSNWAMERVHLAPKTAVTGNTNGTNAWQLELERWGNKRQRHPRLVWLFKTARWALPGAIKLDDTANALPGLAYDAHVQRRRALWGHHLHVPNLSNQATPKQLGRV